MQKNKNNPSEKTIANWFVMRELCYAAMFRHNKHGAFNIPYGGSTYNHKSLRNKVRQICSSQVKELFANARFFNKDFAAFLLENAPSKDDFVFVDPPYDSEFSEYDGHVFQNADHLRLRDVLLGLKARWMLVIKKTPYITSLYKHSDLYISEYKKKYRHRIMGMTHQATHMIVTNYKI